MKKRIFMLVAAVLMAAGVLAGCGGMKESDVAYANDMTENMLQGLSQNDYGVFSRDFSETLKGAIDETAFAAMADQITPVIGTYESKAFAQAADTKQNDVTYTMVVYKAKYSDEDADVLVTVTFGGEEGSKMIEGVFFNSPKLRGE